jgi:hypothetical protein
VVLSRSTAAAVAAWCLMALTGCGGGGGGDKKPPTEELPVVPVGDSTNYTVMSMDQASSVVLSGYGMASQTYHVAAGGLWSDTSVVTGMDFSANVAGVTDVRSLPSSLSVEWSFSGVPVDYPGGDYNASLPVTTLNMSVASHPVAGITLLRHASGTQATGVDLCAATIDAAALNVRYTKLAYWKYRRPNTGFYSASSKVLGAHVAGIPTVGSVVGNASSGSYSGVMSGVMDSGLVSVGYEFGELSSLVAMTYDKATGQATVVLSGFKYQQNDCLISGLNNRQTMSYGFPMFEGASCTATVDRANNTFRCTIDDSGNDIQWDVRGRFFGPQAREFAGTVAISGALTANFSSEGVAAAFSAVRTTLP